MIKHRYEYCTENKMIIDNELDNYVEDVVERLNTQDENKKDLLKQYYLLEDEIRQKDQQIVELKQQLKEKDKEFEQYRKDVLEGYNISENEIFKLKCEIIQLKTQLHTQPKEIVEKIRNDFEERIKNTLWSVELPVGKVCNMINDVLDEILKEYGGE